MSLEDEKNIYCENQLCVGANEVRQELEKCLKANNGSVKRYFWAQGYRCPTCKALFYKSNVCSVNDRNAKYDVKIYSVTTS